MISQTDYFIPLSMSVEKKYLVFPTFYHGPVTLNTSIPILPIARTLCSQKEYMAPRSNPWTIIVLWSGACTGQPMLPTSVYPNPACDSTGFAHARPNPTVPRVSHPNPVWDWTKLAIWGGSVMDRHSLTLNGIVLLRI